MFYKGKKQEIHDALSQLTLDLPHYQDLEWRFEVQVRLLLLLLLLFCFVVAAAAAIVIVFLVVYSYFQMVFWYIPPCHTLHTVLFRSDMHLYWKPWFTLTNNKHSKSLREPSLVIIVTWALGRLEDGVLELYVQSDQTCKAASSDKKSNQSWWRHLLRIFITRYMFAGCQWACSCDMEVSLLGRGTDHPWCARSVLCSEHPIYIQECRYLYE